MAYARFPLFLDASSHLYKRVCPSVGWSVGPSVRQSVGPSVDHAFVKIAENGVMQDEDASYVIKGLVRCVLTSL